MQTLSTFAIHGKKKEEEEENSSSSSYSVRMYIVPLKQV